MTFLISSRMLITIGNCHRSPVTSLSVTDIYILLITSLASPSTYPAAITYDQGHHCPVPVLVSYKAMTRARLFCKTKFVTNCKKKIGNNWWWQTVMPDGHPDLIPAFPGLTDFGCELSQWPCFPCHLAGNKPAELAEARGSRNRYKVYRAMMKPSSGHWQTSENMLQRHGIISHVQKHRAGKTKAFSVVGFEPLHRSKDVWDFWPFCTRGEICTAAARGDRWVQAQACRAAPSAPSALPVPQSNGGGPGTPRPAEKGCSFWETQAPAPSFVGPRASPPLSERQRS